MTASSAVNLNGGKMMEPFTEDIHRLRGFTEAAD